MAKSVMPKQTSGLSDSSEWDGISALVLSTTALAHRGAYLGQLADLGT
jgi:hypothetical protein